MSTSTAFGTSKIIGDACFYLVKEGKVTTVLRQWVNGDAPDPRCQKEVLPESEIPAELLAAYEALKAGELPVVH